MYPGGSSDKKGKSHIEKIVIEYHPEAADEFIEAAQFYESREKGLGKRFIRSIESSLNFIKQTPRIGQDDPLGRRKYVVKKFPYLLIYSVRTCPLLSFKVDPKATKNKKHIYRMIDSKKSRLKSRK
jgi:plasmid stabilization system protein ParE